MQAGFLWLDEGDFAFWQKVNLKRIARAKVPSQPVLFYVPTGLFDVVLCRFYLWRRKNTETLVNLRIVFKRAVAFAGERLPDKMRQRFLVQDWAVHTADNIV